MRTFMSIAERLRMIAQCAIVLTAFSVGGANAHPVSQGALDIVIFPERVAVTARVSMEEVLVAAAYGGKNLSTLEMLRQHGEYLLAHFRVSADRQRLTGRVVKIPEQTGGQPVYQLEYEIGGSTPARISLEEDLLREFEFAPGNPWEASYVVRARRGAGQEVEGLLLTWREPLVLDVNALASGSASLDRMRMAREYINHGVMHILSGYDHQRFHTRPLTDAHSLSVKHCPTPVKHCRADDCCVDCFRGTPECHFSGEKPRCRKTMCRFLLRFVSRSRLRWRFAKCDGRNGRFDRGPGDRRVQSRRRDRPSDGRSPDFLHAKNDAR